MRISDWSSDVCSSDLARVVEALGRSGRSYAVVREMAEPEQSQALEEAELESVEELGDALDWEARGWPSWAEYRPIAEAALRHGLPMRPGKPSRALEIGRAHV